MKKTWQFLTFLVVFGVGLAQAAPFLGCDPPAATDTKPTYYVVTGGTWIPASVPAQPDGSIRMDVALAPIGLNKFVVKACINDPTQGGEVCSPTAPFDWDRRSAPTKPAGLKISP
jgi:hypothetical protein